MLARVISVSMPIKCTFGDVARLRENQLNPGPLSKLVNADFESIVDKWRVAKFVKAVSQEIEDYEHVLLALGKKFGVPVEADYQICPEHQAEFDAELLKLKQKFGTPTPPLKGLYRILPENQELFAAEVRKLDVEVRDILSANPLPPSVCDLLTPKDLIILGPLVVEPETETAAPPPSSK
jgi:hypothetical protein